MVYDITNEIVFLGRGKRGKKFVFGRVVTQFCFVVETHSWVWLTRLTVFILLSAEQIIESQGKKKKKQFFTSVDSLLPHKMRNFALEQNKERNESVLPCSLGEIMGHILLRGI